MISSRIYEPSAFPKNAWDNTKSYTSTRPKRCIGKPIRSAFVTKIKYGRKRFKMRKIWWWNPHLHSTFGDFCSSTTIGGLKFLTKRKLNISERLFWLIAFLTGVAAAFYLIDGFYLRYSNNPIVVAFKSKEMSQYDLPFPAVTICSVNKFPKAKYEELHRRAMQEKDASKVQTEKLRKNGSSVQEELLLSKTICEVQRSFAKIFNYGHNRGQFSKDINGTIGGDKKNGLIAYMYKHTLRCDEIIRLCSWRSIIFNCSFLFKKILTDYGRCCSFNMLPNELLYSGRKYPDWTVEEVEGWKQWKYFENWAILEDHIEYPRRQIKPGSSYGLSLLIDANTDQYFCPISDSEGFRYSIHSPLERPQIFKFGAVIGTGKEVSIRVIPQVILADPSIKDFDKKKRKCVFGTEVKLDIYKPYTKNNCLDECIANIIAKNCSCIPYMSATRQKSNMCIKTDDILCIQDVSRKLYEFDEIQVYCGHCVSLCENIIFEYHSTEAHLQDAATLWKSYRSRMSEPIWADHKMSIVHIYYFKETTIPRLRTTLYGLSDLIANTGGVLAICLGVSIISVVETIYFFTLRILWIKIRRQTMGYRVANIFWIAFQKYKLKAKEKKDGHITFIDI